MVIVHQFPEGQPFAIEVRPGTTATTRVAPSSGLAEITFTERNTVAVTLILPEDVARQVLGESRWSALADSSDIGPL